MSEGESEGAFSLQGADGGVRLEAGVRHATLQVCDDDGGGTAYLTPEQLDEVAKQCKLTAQRMRAAHRALERAGMTKGRAK